MQHDCDLHIALEVDAQTLHAMFAKGKAAGIETRGISDHGFIHSIYFRDPNGYVIELTPVEPVRAARGFSADSLLRMVPVCLSHSVGVVTRPVYAGSAAR